MLYIAYLVTLRSSHVKVVKSEVKGEKIANGVKSEHDETLGKKAVKPIVDNTVCYP